MLKKALLGDESRNQIEPRTGFLQFYVKNEESMQDSPNKSEDYSQTSCTSSDRDKTPAKIRLKLYEELCLQDFVMDGETDRRTHGGNNMSHNPDGGDIHIFIWL